MNPKKPEEEKNYIPAKLIARYTLVVMVILIAMTFLWVIQDALLMAFGSVILATIFYGSAKGLQKILPFSYGLSLLTVGVIVLLITGSFVLLFGPQISSEFDQLVTELPEKFTELRETISEWPGGDQMMDEMSNNNNGEESGADGQQQNNDQDEEGEGSSVTDDLPADAGNYILRGGATLIDILSTTGIVFIVGIYFAIHPHMYKKGLLLLVPKHKEERVSDVLDASGRALWQWLKGQMIAMAFVGITLTIGLMIIGVPLAFVLGFLGGLFEFIPFIGPFAAAAPILLLALSVDLQTAFFAAILLLIVQQLEGNVVTPLVQHQMVYLPPSVAILCIVAFGLVFGIAGVILATPLTVIVMVMIGMLYVQDVLGKEITVPGQTTGKKKEVD